MAINNMAFDPTQYGATPVAKGSFDPSKYGATPVQAPPTQTPQPSFGQQVGKALGSIGPTMLGALGGATQQIGAGYRQAQQATNPLQETAAGMHMLGGVAGALGAPLAPITNPTIGAGINAAANQIGGMQGVQQFAMSRAGQTTANTAQFVNDTANVLPFAAGAMEPKALANSAENTVSSASNLVNTLKSAKYTPEPQTTSIPFNEPAVTNLYSRAIKPSSTGISTAAQKAQANARVVSGLRAISDNKASLTFKGADGETITGAAPKTVDQLSQAIDQTKGSLFKQYDALAKQAGESGVVVDGSKIGAELQPVIESKSLAIANPKAVQYAKDVQARLTEAGGIDAQTAQEVIQHYNDSLKAFYRNPSYDTASQSSVDALIANKFRGELDKGITGATGEQYAALKKQYGALASMEKDVNRRNIVWGRQNQVGLASNLANISSGAELVRGLISMNPADIAASAAIKGVQKYIQHLNNPDVGVSKIFAHLDKSSPPSTGSMTAPAAASTIEKPSPTPTTEVPEAQVKRPWNSGFIANPLAPRKGLPKEGATKAVSSPKPTTEEIGNLDAFSVMDSLHKLNSGSFMKNGKLDLESFGEWADLVKKAEKSSAKLTPEEIGRGKEILRLTQ